MSRVFCRSLVSKFSIARVRWLSLAVAPLVAFLQFAAPAQGVLLVYDPFVIGGAPGEYAQGDEVTGIDVIGGQNPVSSPTPFYAGGWIQSGGDAQAVVPGTLSYPNLPGLGGHLSDAVQFACCSFGRNGRELGTILGEGRLPRTIYQSFMVDFGDQGTDDPTQFGKRAVEWWNGGIGDEFLAVDVFVNSFSGVNEFTLAVTTPSGTQTELLNGGGLTLENMSGVHFIVMKFEFNPADLVDPLGTAADDDRVTLYLDPTDSVEANWVPAASLSVNASDLLITHHGLSTNFTFSGAGHSPARFDELRWGDTFADVTPFIRNNIPEPSTLAIAGFALGGMVLAARRRAKRQRPH